jgi:hypothetical protein
LPAPNRPRATLYRPNTRKETDVITKLAIFVGGIVLMAGVALAGTMTSLGSGNSPAGQTISPPAATTTGILDDRGQENELRGRENEAGEDLRGRENEAESSGPSRARCRRRPLPRRPPARITTAAAMVAAATTTRDAAAVVVVTTS